MRSEGSGESSDIKRWHRASIIDHDHLMEASHDRLSAAARSDTAIEQLIAARVFDNPKDFGRWECHHAGMMRRIVEAGTIDAQKCELLSASMALVQRKALFEYLRDSGTRGKDRVRLIGYFFRQSDYSRAVIAEHGVYIRSAASYMCSSHIGAKVMLDDVFVQPLLEYEELYSQYFRVYCQLVVAQDRDDEDMLMQPLLVSLKTQVCDWRKALFVLAQSHSGIWRRPRGLGLVCNR